jgi:hypothetical protein
MARGRTYFWPKIGQPTPSAALILKGSTNWFISHFFLAEKGHTYNLFLKIKHIKGYDRFVPFIIRKYTKENKETNLYKKQGK